MAEITPRSPSRAQGLPRRSEAEAEPHKRMREYVDFLGGQPPYDALDAADLEALARLIEVEYFTAGTTIVDAGGSA